LRKELPIGVQKFSEMIRGNYLYVDKTEHLHRLIKRGKYYFLSRPRRFGKSLMISTLKEIFEGNRHLFRGLWIEDKIDWEPRPVISLDFSEVVSRDIPLQESINTELDRIARDFGLTLKANSNDQKFRELIEQVGAERQVAILVDEYDKPIINFLDDLPRAEENREIMKNLYSVIKGNDQHIAFFMLTGVSKFSQVSIFSDLNNLYDITVDQEFSEMLGYTETELKTNFGDYISDLKKALESEYPEIETTIKEWYDGYSWDGINFVYNPFSILNLFRKQSFRDYWFATGTPTFLLQLIKQRNYSFIDLKNKEISLRAFNKFDVLNIEINSLLFQTGYLTIKKIHELKQTVVLDFPNKEVENAFSFFLLSEFAEKSHENTDSLILRMNSSLQDGNVAEFIESMKVMFANIAYPIQPAKESGISDMEKYYHSMFYLVLKLLGYNVESEIITSTGRIDAVIETVSFIYVLEFKISDATAALSQIRNRNYHQKYRASGKKIVLVGIGFDVEGRNIGEYLSEIVEE
jgi:hypothetical protein